MIGQQGNLGIAGHRDGFFRVLQDVTEGDLIEITGPDQQDWYSVQEIRIVAPADVSVLNPTPHRSLTLITCYPFYFVGHAPMRYIVRAVQESTERAALGGDANYRYERSTDKHKEKQK